jgi:hypothetical protein
MLLRVATQTIVAAVVIGLLAAGWQLTVGSDGTADGGTTRLDRVHHDDD